MICVSKEYEIETKMEQEQWLQLKMLVLLGYNWNIFAQWWGGGRKNLVGRRVFYGQIFLDGEGMSKFLAGGRDSPPFSPVGKTLYIYIYIYICNLQGKPCIDRVFPMCKYIYMYVYIYIYIYIYTYLYIYICIYVHIIYIYTYICYI